MLLRPRAIQRQPKRAERGAKDDLVFWENCQSRVTAYLTTNGQIAISLCGLYVTAASVFSVFGLQRLEEGDHAVFSFLLPAFSVLVLVLAMRVYIWIRQQLEYSTVVGVHPARLKGLMSLEEWEDRCQAKWDQKDTPSRMFNAVLHGSLSLIALPIKMRDIYMYYFLIYTWTPIASAVWAWHNGAGWYVPVLWTVAVYLVYVFSYVEVHELDATAPLVASEMLAEFEDQSATRSV